MGHGLAGTRVLVTRPSGQQAGLVAAIEAAGGVALHLPAMAIQPYHQTESTLRLRHATAYEWLIFISRNAVEHALPHLPRRGLPKLVAIGSATAAALQDVGLAVAVQPGRYDSEAVLARLPRDMSGQRVLIVRGVGGREQLATGLQARGASVDYAEVYRRSCPALPDTELPELLAQGIDIITVSSGEMLRNLLQLAGAACGQVLQLPLVVMSERGAALARTLGFPHTHIYTATQASDAGILAAIRIWHSERTA